MSTVLYSLLVLLAITALEQPCQADRGPLRSTFYLGTSFKTSSLAGESANWLRVQAGTALSDRFSIGGAFSTLASNNTAPRLGPRPDTDNPLTTVAYAGAVLTYTHPSHSDFHPTVELLIGDGWLGLAPAYSGGFTPHGSDRRDRFLVIEPSLSLQIDLSRRFHALAGAGYLFTSGVGSPRDFDLEYDAPSWGYTNRNVSSLTANFGLTFSFPRI